jgi:hypothetical protein
LELPLLHPESKWKESVWCTDRILYEPKLGCRTFPVMGERRSYKTVEIL